MGYKKVINERQEEMGEDNNSIGGYQPTEDNGQVGQQNPYEGAPQYGQNDQNYGQSDGQYGQNDQNYGQSDGQYGQNYGQPGGQYDQNYGQPGGQYGQNYGQPGGQYGQGYGQYGQGYGQPGDPYGQNYANQDMNMGGGPAYPQNNMQPQESKGVSIASMVLGIFSLTFGCCITYVGIATAIAGLITGIISLEDKKPGKGMAIAGIIMSAIALVFLVFCIILVLTSDTYQDMVDEILRQIQSGSY